MENFEKPIEIAVIGVGVVFLALASLTLVTISISRYIKVGKSPNVEIAEGRQINGNHGIGLKPDDDPMFTAAMVAAIQVVDGRLPAAAGGRLSSTALPGFDIWRSHGRQLLMQSQGLPRNPRTPGK